MWFQEKSIPHHRGNRKFQRGGRVKSPGNFKGLGGGGFDSQINFQMVQFPVLFSTDLVVRKLPLTDFGETF